jgi:uncharacterized membrane protein
MTNTAAVALVLSFLIGIVAGLRAMTAPAVVSWAARLGLLELQGTFLGFLGHAVTPWIFTIFAVGELVTDQLATTPSRTVPVQFVTRVIVGALCGAAIGLSSGALALGGALGSAGAVLGTLGGREFRARLANAFHRDRPAAFIEDGIAIGSALLIALLLP